MRTLILVSVLFLISACEQPSGEQVEINYNVLQPAKEVVASRTFSGPTQFPPATFAGYGIVAFPNDPKSGESRFLMFCKAYMRSFVTSNALVEAGVEKRRQMVTVMPVSSNQLSDRLATLGEADACELALKNYGLLQAQEAIRKAENSVSLTDGQQRLSGRGPFLLAWAPGQTFGSTDALVLAADLSNSSSPEQIQSDMMIWRRDIETNPKFWRTGWNVEGIRLIAQRWVDRRGEAIIKLFGNWS